MTLLSKIVIAGYCFLHIAFVILLILQHKNQAKRKKHHRKMRWGWILLFLAAAAVPVLAVFTPEGYVSFFLQRIGNIFLAFDLHIIGLYMLASTLSGIICLFLGYRPWPGLPAWAITLILITGIAVPAYGMYHAQTPVVHTYTADFRETAETDDHVRIALISDLHLSVNSHISTIRKMVRLLNEQKPDLVLVAGDVFTSSYAALRNPEQYAQALHEIQAPMGIYAVYGNHDIEETLFGGFAVHPVSMAFRSKQIEQFFDDCGFRVLYDETTDIADGKLTLAGRIDGNKAGDGTRNRMSPAELLKGTDPSRLTLVLEHEPVEYKELREAGADIVLSGHTHDGQVFPGNLYVKMTNENGYGQKTLYGMETFVTSGVGTFGPPMRTGTDSEIMIIDLYYSAAD